MGPSFFTPLWRIARASSSSKRSSGPLEIATQQGLDPLEPVLEGASVHEELPSGCGHRLTGAIEGLQRLHEVFGHRVSEERTELRLHEGLQVVGRASE